MSYSNDHSSKANISVSEHNKITSWDTGVNLWVEFLYRHDGPHDFWVEVHLPTPKGAGPSYAMSETFQGTHFGSSGPISSLVPDLTFSTYNEKR